MAFHLYDINELFSNADGAVQFIELAVGSFNGESFWQGQSISVTQGSTAHRFTFSTDLPSSQTANTKVLIATQGFADLGIVTPDFIVPAGFLFTSGGASVNFAGVDIVPYTALPTDGTLSIDRNGATAINSPTNFAGNTGTVPIAVIGGTEGADDLVGTERADALTGGAGNDTLNGGGGNDTLDGGAGMDTAAYSGARAAYAIGGSGSAIAGPEGNDSLAGIERLRFSDRGVAFDLGQNQSAGNTVRVIGAAFDAPAIGQHPDWVGIGLQLFDGGMSMRQVCDLVAQGMNLNNTAFVTQVYTNVVGVAPDAASLAAFVGLLQGNGGAMTQGQLLELAATIDLNATININLAGLHGSGVEFV